MPNRPYLRPLLAGAVAAAALLATACGSSTHPARAAGTGAAGGAHAAAQQLAASPATGAEQLGARMAAALAKVSSVHLAVSSSAGTGTADLRLAGGTLAAADVIVAGGPWHAEARLIGSQAWLQLPQSMRTAGKPWTLISSDSSDPRLSELAHALQMVTAMPISAVVSMLLGTTSSFAAKGQQAVDGVPTTRYTMTADPAKLPLPGGAGGHGSLPLVSVDLWVSAGDLPVQLTAAATVGAHPVDVTVRFTGYDKQVTITAPPADQVAR